MLNAIYRWSLALTHIARDVYHIMTYKTNTDRAVTISPVTTTQHAESWVSIREAWALYFAGYDMLTAGEAKSAGRIAMHECKMRFGMNPPRIVSRPRRINHACIYPVPVAVAAINDVVMKRKRALEYQNA